MKRSIGTNAAMKSRTLTLSTVIVVALVMAGCAGMPVDISQIPFVSSFLQPTPTFTPTPVPTATPTPEPTPTPKPGETPIPPTPTPIPTPQVTIPNGFSPVVDDNLGYSFAVPSGWTALDLRSSQFQNLANTFGMGEQMAPLNEFLASPEGDSLGYIYVTDLMSAMFGGLPTALNVFVVDVPGATPDWLLDMIRGSMEQNSQMLGDVEVEALDTAIVNGIPGVRGSAVADLSAVGMPNQVFAKVVGMIANDKIYVLTLVTEEANKAEKEPVFDQIIGSFRPE